MSMSINGALKSGWPALGGLAGARPGGLAQPQARTDPGSSASTSGLKQLMVQTEEPVTVHLSIEAQGRLDLVFGPERTSGELGGKSPHDLPETLDETESTQEETKGGSGVGEDALSEEEKVVLTKMRARDLAVRAHEQAHVAAAGGLAGSPTYVYQVGPDGKRYAIGGQVSIDTTTTGNAEKDIEKARKIKASAMAPGSPSGRDYAVAARASQIEAGARSDQITGPRETDPLEAPDQSQTSLTEQSPELQAYARAAGLISAETGQQLDRVA